MTVTMAATHPITLATAIGSLAGRLCICSDSPMRNLPAAQADMALAARVLHSLLQTGTANRAIELD
jgi:hypothetical protein